MEADASRPSPGGEDIGCAELIVGASHWFACVLAGGPLPAQGAAPPVVVLPDTEMPVIE